jgi:transposase
MSRKARPIVLSPDERAQLERIVRARTSSQQQARRAQIVLRAAEGASNTAIAAALGLARHTVQHWRDRFATERLAGLRDHPHCPPPRRYPAPQQAAIVVLACRAPAEVGWEGQTHWSIADLAQYIQAHPELGLGAPSKSTGGRILQAHDLRLDRL